jgi:hypothetical protein
VRKRAWQTLAVDVVLGIVAVIWVSTVTPHWLTELREVMRIYSAHGGANDPGILGSPTSLFRKGAAAVYPGMVCDLQSIVGVFHDDPRFYNPVTYLFCAPFLAAWAFVSFRTPPSKAAGYLAIAAIVPFTLLITYHRTTDAKLLLLTVPACALLWREGGALKWLAIGVTSAGFIVSGDIPLVILGILNRSPDWADAGVFRKMGLVFTSRPVPLALLAMGMFYLWVYVRRARTVGEEPDLLEQDSMQPVQAEG